MELRILMRLIVVCLALPNSLFAQDWYTIRDSNSNYKDIIEQSELYFSTDFAKKQREYKHYMRWHEYMSYRVGPDGSIKNFSAFDVKAVRVTRSMATTDSRATHGAWSEVGPGDFNLASSQGGIGRLNAVTIDPANSNRLWASSPAGGLWRSTNAGSTWAPFTSGLGPTGCTDLVIDHTNSNIMYLLTGDGERAYTSSIGVLKSTDGGNTWTTTDLTFNYEDNVRMYKMIMSPTDHNTLFACGSNGIWRTVNGGGTWVQLISNWTFDIEIPADSTSMIFASGINWVARSLFNGDFGSWATINTSPGAIRTEIAYSPSTPGKIFAMYADGVTGFKSLRTSSNYGNSGTWLTIATSPNILGRSLNGLDSVQQALSGNMEIIVSPTNGNVLYVAGINLWRSTNGGVTWIRKTYWDANNPPYVHADFLDLEFSGSTLYAINDGGIYKTSDGGDSWTDLTPGISNATFYDFDVVDNKYVGGCQDNGTFEGITNNLVADHIYGGDGFAAAYKPSNTNIRFITSQNNIVRRDGGSADVVNPPGLTDSPFWFAEVDFDKGNDDYVFVTSTNSQKMFRGKWNGSSMDWTDTDIDDISTAPVREMAQGINNTKVMYVNTRNGLYKTSDITVTNPVWQTINFSESDQELSDVLVEPDNTNRIWVCVGGYDEGEKVFRSPDNGITWFNMSAGLPNVAPICMLYEPGSTNDGIYLGTTIGVFYRNNDIGEWIYFSNELPPISINDLDHDGTSLYAATWGRGIWKTQLYSSCPSSFSLTAAGDPATPQTIGKRIYQASNTIYSSRVLTGGVGTDVQYNAGNSVIMEPGFVAQAGVLWEARIQGCPD